MRWRTPRSTYRCLRQTPWRLARWKRWGGAFPVSATCRRGDWLEHGRNASSCRKHRRREFGLALLAALRDDRLREGRPGSTARRVEAEAVNEDNMLSMERHYYRLAGYPLPEASGDYDGRALGLAPPCKRASSISGWNNSTQLPEGSSTRICLPPTPVTMSFLK